MSVQAPELFSARRGEGRWNRILRFPLVRMPLCLLFLAIFLIPHNTVIADFIAPVTGPRRTMLNALDALVSLVALLLLYRLYVCWVERRDAREIGLSGAAREFGLGVLVSFGIVGFMVAVMALAGFYRVEGLASPRVLLDGLFYFGIGAFVQVVIFRLMAFRLVEEMLGTWVTLVLVAAVFGLAHLGNANATVGTSLALALSDVLLASAFIFSRRLWMVWGMHLGWNFAQDGVLGLANSGLTRLPSWITARVHGPTWLTGGSFGIEAAPVQVLLSMAVGLLILRKAWKAGQVVRPAWKR